MDDFQNNTDQIVCTDSPPFYSIQTKQERGCIPLHNSHSQHDVGNNISSTYSKRL